MLVARFSVVLSLLLSSAGSIVCAEGVAGRAERRAERVTADDDPILIPRSAVPPLRFGALDRTGLDPEITGSAGKPARKAQARCNMLAWFPGRPPDQEFREVC